MSRREQQLSTLQRLKSRDTDEARRILIMLRREHEQQLTRLEELKNYMQEYRDGMSDSCSPSVHMNREHFMTRLQRAVDAQQEIIRQCAARVADAEEIWASRHTEGAGVGKLLLNEKREQQRCAEAREQKTLDEHASQQYCRAASSGFVH